MGGKQIRIPCVIVLVCAQFLIACGGGGSGRATLEQSGLEAGGGPASPELHNGEISAQLWQELSDELARVRGASAAKPFEQNSFVRVRDFRVSVIDSGLRFDWSYRNHGDYDLNLETGISDLSVLGRFFGMREGDPGWEEAKVADGDGNGEIGIGDVSPIGQNFGTRVDGYTLYSAEDGNLEGALALAEFDTAELRDAGGSWPAISHVIVAGNAALHYFVRPWREDSGGVRHEGPANSSGQQVEEGSKRGDWWKANHDMQNSGLSTLPGPETGHIWWEYPLEDPMNVQPVYDSEGTIYIGDSQGLHAVNGDGTEQWTYTSPAAVSTSAAISRSGTVVFGCADGSVLAVDQSGNLLWSVASGAAISGDIGMTDDGTILFGNKAGTVMALAPDGTEQWRHESGSAILDGPAIDTRGRIHLRREAGLLMLDGDGAVLEQDDNNTQLSSTGLMILGTPFEVYSGNETEYHDTLYFGTGFFNVRLGTPLDANENTWLYNQVFYNLETGYEVLRGSYCTAPGSSIIFNLNSEEFGERLVRTDFADSISAVSTPKYPVENGISCDAHGNALVSFDPYFYKASQPKPSLISYSPEGSEKWKLYSPDLALSRSVPYPGSAALLLCEHSLLAIGGPLSGNLPEQVVVTYAGAAGKEGFLKLGLKWERSNGAESYLIHRVGKAEPLLEVSGLELEASLEDDPDPSSTIQYTVTAVNRQGQAPPSEPAVPGIKLDKPLNIIASQGEFSNRIELSWDPVYYATGYRIWRDIRNDSAVIDEIDKTTQWTDTELTDWIEHEYYIRAVRNGLEGSSNEATGWLKRGTGDSGAASWSSHAGNPGNSRLSAFAGPTSLGTYSEQIITMTHEDTIRINREFVLGSTGSIYTGYSDITLAIDGDDNFRWAYSRLYGTPVVLDDGSLYGLGYLADSVRVSSNGLLLSEAELTDLRSVNLAANGDLLLVRYHSVTRMDQAGNILWDFPFSDVSPAGYLVEGPQGNLYFSTDVRRDPPVPMGNLDGGSPIPSIEREIICLDNSGSELWREPYWSKAVASIKAGPDGTIWLNANLGFLEDSPDQENTPSALYSVSEDGNLQWHSQGVTPMFVLAVDRDGNALVRDDSRILRRVSPAGSFDLAISPLGTESVRSCISDAEGNIFLHYELLIGSNFRDRFMALDADGAELWSIEEDDWDDSNMAIYDDGSLVIVSRKVVPSWPPSSFRITRIGGS